MEQRELDDSICSPNEHRGLCCVVHAGCFVFHQQSSCVKIVSVKSVPIVVLGQMYRDTRMYSAIHYVMPHHSESTYSRRLNNNSCEWYQNEGWRRVIFYSVYRADVLSMVHFSQLCWRNGCEERMTTLSRTSCQKKKNPRKKSQQKLAGKNSLPLYNKEISNRAQYILNHLFSRNTILLHNNNTLCIW